MEDNFYDFLFAFLHLKSLLEKVSKDFIKRG